MEYSQLSGCVIPTGYDPADEPARLKVSEGQYLLWWPLTEDDTYLAKKLFRNIFDRQNYQKLCKSFFSLAGADMEKKKKTSKELFKIPKICSNVYLPLNGHFLYTRNYIGFLIH